jgi:hypothetical protein
VKKVWGNHLAHGFFSQDPFAGILTATHNHLKETGKIAGSSE